jgi:hypothetical protein
MFRRPLTLKACFVFFAALHESHIRSIQPPSIAEIRKLLLRRQTEGFSIRKRRDDGWEAKAFAWYQTVLDDLNFDLWAGLFVAVRC